MPTLPRTPVTLGPKHIVRALVMALGVISPTLSAAATQVVFQTNEQVHVGDETISSWSRLYGTCVTLRLPDVRQGDQISFRYRPYGLERATVQFLETKRPLAAQIPRNGKKRPNYWGAPEQVFFTASRDAPTPLIEVCAQNVAPSYEKVDYDDFMIMDLLVEVTDAPQPIPQPTPQPAPQPARGETYATITQTKWSLNSSPKSCGLNGQITEYQRFLPTEYYNVIGGKEFHANDGEVNYFDVDEAGQRFEARYSTYTKFTPAPWNVSTYAGQLNPDGSMTLVQELQQIDTNTMNAPRPKYSYDRKSYTLWPCDNLPQERAAAQGATRVLFTISDGQNIAPYASCEALFDQIFATTDQMLITTLQEVNGQWSGKNSHTKKCESTMPNLCPSFNGEWINTPQVVTQSPLTLRVTDSKCTSTHVFTFSGDRARVDVTHNASCPSELYSYSAIECTQN